MLGAGTMGHGIAHAAIAAGYEHSMYDVSTAALDKGRGGHRRHRQEGRRAREGCRWGRRSHAAAAGRHDATRRMRSPRADFVIEAAPERIDLKLQLFADIERFAPKEAVVGSNTSALEHHRDGGHAVAALACGRNALLQSRPQDEADRNRAGARNVAGGARRHSKRCPAGWGRKPCSSRNLQGSSRPE